MITLTVFYHPFIYFLMVMGQKENIFFEFGLGILTMVWNNETV
jgi:hypothetical protein